MSPAERLAKLYQAEILLDDLLADLKNDSNHDEFAQANITRAARKLDLVARHWRREGSA